MYYLYHIPGKKIGVTRNLNTRVTLMQGYKENEYEVLEQSDDIDYISDREIELQKSYGYKVDRKLYKNLFNKKITHGSDNPYYVETKKQLDSVGKGFCLAKWTQVTLQ